MANPNCYAHAISFPNSIDPGKLSGKGYKNSADAGPAAEHDGLIKIDSYKQVQNGYYPVALWISSASDVDYHWAKQEKEGNWTHKPGQANINTLDASEEEINDNNPPHQCNMNFRTFFAAKPQLLRMAEAQGWCINYDVFVGYYQCPIAGLSKTKKDRCNVS